MSISFEPTVDAPYPGLRPFLRDESMVFFGRDKQIDDVLSRLKKRQFLAIVGSSGCGKSSLVRAGVLPALESGLMGELGSAWYVADMKPGDAPMTNLANAMIKCGVLGTSWSDSPQATALLTADLWQSDKSLVNLIRQAQLPPHTNLLILADQFEEIFRFQQKDPNEALAFVNLLLTSAQDQSTPIFVVLTMRTDFLGECTTFPGLPEILNDSQYLCPRLTRDQLADAIQSPAEVFDSQVEPALVTRLINDAEGNSDQLPLVQHVLSRIWNRLNGGSMAFGKRSASLILRLEDYVQTGGLVRRSQGPGSTIGVGATVRGSNVTGNSLYESQTNALSQHLDEAYFSLADDSPASADQGPGHQPSRKQLIAQMLFRSLAIQGASGAYVRRPTKVKNVAEIAGCSVADVITVVDVFRRDDRCFLTPAKPDSKSLPTGTSDLNPETLLDISHEALIRQWQRLGAHGGQAGNTQRTPSWLEIEENSRRRYRRLAEATENEQTAGLMRNPELEVFHQWWNAFRPSRAWANACLDGSFDRAEQFLKKSLAQAAEEEREKQRDQQARLAAAEDFATKMRFRARAVAVVAVLAIVGLMVAVWESKKAAQLERIAKDGQQKALNEMKIANQARAAALASQRLAEASQAREERLLEQAERLAYVGSISSAQQAWEDGIFADAWKHLNSAPWKLRGWEHDYLWTLFNLNQTTLREHSSAVNSVAYSSDGKMFVTASDDRKIKIWDASKGTVLKTLEGHASPVNAAVFSKDNRLLVSGSRDCTAKVWDVTTEKVLQTFKEHTAPVLSVAFNPEGTEIVSGGQDNKAKIWLVSDGMTRLTIEGHEESVLSVAFSPNGERVASGSYDSTVKVWNITGDNIILTYGDEVWSSNKVHQSEVTCVGFSPDGTKVVSGSADYSFCVWNAESGAKMLDVVAHQHEITSVAFSPDGKRIVSGSYDHNVKVWDSSDGNELHRYMGHSDYVNCVAFSPDNTHIVSGGKDNTVKIWDSTREQKSHTLDIEQLNWRNIAFSNDGCRIVTGNFFSEVAMMDSESGEVLQTFRGHSSEITGVAFSRDGDRIVSGSLDGTVKVWETNRTPAITNYVNFLKRVRVAIAHVEETIGTEIPIVQPVLQTLFESSFPQPTHTLTNDPKAKVLSVAINPRGDQILSGNSDGTVKIWNALTGKEIMTLEGHQVPVNCVAFSPQGDLIASGGDDCLVKLWDASKNGEALRTLEKHKHPVRCIAFSADGKRIASGGTDSRVNVWNTSSGEFLQTLKGHTHKINSLGFSPDGQRIVSGSDDRSVKVWDPEHEQLMLSLPGGDEGVIQGVAFSADGNRILRGTMFHQVIISDASSRQDTLTIENHDETVNSVAFCADRKRIVSAGEDGTVRVFDATTGQEALKIPGRVPVYSAAFNADGGRIVSGGKDKYIRVWDAANGEPLLAWESHTGAVFSVAYSPKSDRIVSGGSDNRVKVWESTSGKELRRLEGHKDAVVSAAFSPDGIRIVSGSLDNTVMVWDSISGAPTPTMSLTDHSGGVNSVGFNFDGSQVVSASADKTVKVWDAASGRVIHTLDRHSGGVNSAVFTPDGKRIASGGSDNSVIVWNAITGDVMLTLKQHTSDVRSVGFGPLGNRIVSGSSDTNIIVWSKSGAPSPDDSSVQDKKGSVTEVDKDGNPLANQGLVSNSNESKTVSSSKVSKNSRPNSTMPRLLGLTVFSLMTLGVIMMILFMARQR